VDRYCELFDDDRSFAQQMSDLGVEIVRPKTELEWYELGKAKSRGKYDLGDKISINSGGIMLGAEATVAIGGSGSRLEVAVAKTKSPMGEIKISLVIKPGKEGFSIVRTRTGSCKVGTKALSKWLLKRGIEKGWYKLERVEGGFKAVGPVEKGHRRR